MTELTHEELTRLLDYDPDTGVFRWKVRRQGIKAGCVAGTKQDSGNVIVIQSKPYLARRLAWFYMNSEIPHNNLFVKNGDKYDDRIDNIGMLPDKPKKLTHKYLKQCIDYNPETGEFKWKITQVHNKYGNYAFCADFDDKKGFSCRTSILNNTYKTLRLIVFWMTGYMPSPNRVVMPIDNNILNMKWSNIKVGSQSEANIKRRAFGLCATKGVHWDKERGKYRSRIRINGKPKDLGIFKTEAEAAAAYQKAAREHHGKLANDGYQHAIYETEWEENEKPKTNVADELLQSAEEAVGIVNGTVKPGKVWVPPVVTEEHPVDF